MLLKCFSWAQRPKRSKPSTLSSKYSQPPLWHIKSNSMVPDAAAILCTSFDRGFVPCHLVLVYTAAHIPKTSLDHHCRRTLNAEKEDHHFSLFISRHQLFLLFCCLSELMREADKAKGLLFIFLSWTLREKPLLPLFFSFNLLEKKEHGGSS